MRNMANPTSKKTASHKKSMPLPGIDHKETFEKIGGDQLANVKNAVANDVERDQQVVEPMSNVNGGTGTIDTTTVDTKGSKKTGRKAKEMTQDERLKTQKPANIKVRALRNGYYKNARKKEGDLFTVDHAEELGSWMEEI
jgi:hypothetical protein